MHKFLENTPVRIICHACGKAFERKIKWMKKNKVLKCKKCGKKIDLTKQAIKKSIKDVTQAITAFETALGKLHKETIKIKKHPSSKERVRKPVTLRVAATPATGEKEKRSFV